MYKLLQRAIKAMNAGDPQHPEEAFQRLPSVPGIELLRELAEIDPINVLELAQIAYRKRDVERIDIFKLANVRLDLTNQWNPDNDDWDPIPYMVSAALMPNIKGRWTFSQYPLHDAIEEINFSDQPTSELLAIFAAAMLKEDSTRVDDTNDFHDTPLKEAARYGNVAMINLLLNYGADVTHSRSPTGTALIAASRNGKLDAVRLLLARGAAASIDSTDAVGDGTALTFASDNGYTAIVRALIDSGADVTDYEDHLYPRTALHQAAKSGHPDVVRLLLQAGADVNGGGQPGVKTPLDMARTNGHDDVVRILEKASAGQETAGMFGSRMVV